MKHTRRRLGFSLIELTVAALILGIVITGAFEMFTLTNKTAMVVDQVTEAQQNLRAVVDLIERDVRIAGYLVPGNAAACAFDETDGPDRLFVSNADVLRSVDDLDSDVASGNLGATFSAAKGWTSSGTSKNITVGQLWLDAEADGDDFSVGSGVIITDRSDPLGNGRVACGEITAMDGKQLTIDFDDDSSLTIAATVNDVVAIPAHMYEVVAATANNPSRLFRDGVLLAIGVEDLQVVFFIDDDEDGLVNQGNELFGNTDTSTYPPAASIDMNQLREIEINVITVTRSDDPNENFVPMLGQIRGNRDPSSLPGPDRRRRRVHSATVRLRNLG